ncbi:hypothetical protein CPB84DRAFT_1495990 [Gymnopilus junonius]|uniref:Uncharacterized protein n=1 Tax=Gymnopilus junonius TaxID=109634 RepID=A0A9P5TRC9_GYMJU|nr:hypothetical protein CPB84DRAFT_1495990 [Gymnopilus junonius]
MLLLLFFLFVFLIFDISGLDLFSGLAYNLCSAFGYLFIFSLFLFPFSLRLTIGGWYVLKLSFRLQRLLPAAWLNFYTRLTGPAVAAWLG